MSGAMIKIMRGFRYRWDKLFDVMPDRGGAKYPPSNRGMFENMAVQCSDPGAFSSISGAPLISDASGHALTAGFFGLAANACVNGKYVPISRKLVADLGRQALPRRFQQQVHFLCDKEDIFLFEFEDTAFAVAPGLEVRSALMKWTSDCLVFIVLLHTADDDYRLVSWLASLDGQGLGHMEYDNFDRYPECAYLLVGTEPRDRVSVADLLAAFYLEPRQLADRIGRKLLQATIAQPVVYPMPDVDGSDDCLDYKPRLGGRYGVQDVFLGME